jgi:hypothetical protein
MSLDGTENRAEDERQTEANFSSRPSLEGRVGEDDFRGLALPGRVQLE